MRHADSSMQKGWGSLHFVKFCWLLIRGRLLRDSRHCAQTLRCLHAGRANEASSGADELKMLDVTVTGLQLERTIERGQAQVADTRARYESSSQSEPTVQKVVKKKKVRAMQCTVAVSPSKHAQ